MNWDAIGAVAEVVGAAGVIFSFLYLGRQIRQSNSTDQLNVTLGLQSSYNEAGDLFLRDSKIVTAGLRDFDGLSPEDKLAFSTIMNILFGHGELVYSHDRKGMLDANSTARTYFAMRFYFEKPGTKEWWERVGREQFSPGFVSFIEEFDK